jgi:ribosomal protein S27E
MPQSTSSSLTIPIYDLNSSLPAASNSSELEAAIPEASITKIGKYQDVYQWSKEEESTFLAWWRKTKWFNEHKDEKTGWTKPRIIWGSARRAKCWDHLSEGARASNGDPVVVCSRCSATLAHPLGGSGSSTAGKHVDTKACKAVSRLKGLTQIPIKESFRAQVCNFCLLY